MSDIVARLSDLSAGDRRALLEKLSQKKRRRVAPLSHAQQRLWFLEHMTPGNPRYNETSAFRLSFAVDIPAFKRSLNDIVQRHETLRTVFEVTDSEPRQCVLPSLDIELPVHDFGHMPAASREDEAIRFALSEASRPFDLSAGPLLRTALIRFTTHDYFFTLTMHHIVCDGWSMKIFFDELAELYVAHISGRNASLVALPVQYADYSVWQRQWLGEREINRQLAYWRDQLAGATPLDLPADFVRPPVPTFSGSRESLAIPPDTYGPLREICRREGATLFMALLTIYQILLHRYTGQTDISVGAPVANRNKPELEHLIGFFVNTLVMRVDLSGNPSFVEALRRVRETTLSAYAHQDLPFERLVEEIHPARDLSRNPLFQVTFQLLNPPASGGASAASGLRVVDLNLETSKFDLRCDLTEVNGGAEGYLEYSLDLFRAETARSMARHFEALVESATRSPFTRTGDLPMLSVGEERQLLVQWNQTQHSFPRDACVHELFQRRAAVQRDAPAATDNTRRVTYGELNTRSNQLARHLQAQGVIAGSLVGVMMSRSVDYVLAIVSILKCGAAFVPMDPAYPGERLAGMLSDSNVQLVLTTSHFSNAIPRQVAQLRLDEVDPPWERESAEDFSCHADLQSLAYVIFTSGSTGRPKGVEVPHSALLNLVHWHNAEYVVTPNDRASLFASPAFDASVWEMWPYLAAGASLCVPDEATRASSIDLVAWIVRNGITISFLPTPVAESVLDLNGDNFGHLRLLLTGGDKLREFPKRVLPFRLVNHYGPTENAVVATFTDVTSGPENEAPPIGRPISNVQAYVLDRHLRPVPVGVRGELHLAGRSLARGYLNDDNLTRQRFIPNPFDASPGSLMYRTGDLVRYRSDGNLEFHGRVDRQVKIRGFRIEPGDIEATLDQHPAVAQSLVVPYESAHGASVAAYIVAAQRPALPGEDGASVADVERIGEWCRIYEAVYGTNHERIADFDIVGWNSSYTGEALGEDQMAEQVDGTVRRIEELGGKRILEIGCGTGLLLLRLAGNCERYVGTDFSGAVLSQLREQCDQRGWSHVELLERRAEDFTGIDGDFDVVVLNSVVQYFPGLDYLTRVLHEAAKRLGAGGWLYVGDVRRLKLLRWLYGGIELSHAGEETSAEELTEGIERRRYHEQELLLEECWFDLWGKQEGLGRPRVELRRGRHHNELTKFRYDVLLPKDETEQIQAWAELDWPDIGSLDALKSALLASDSDMVRVKGLPNARVSAEKRLMDVLGQAEAKPSALELRRDIRQSEGQGVEPEDLWELEQGGAWFVRVGWSEDEGSLCACIARNKPGRTRWNWSATFNAEGVSSTVFANDVLSQPTQQEIAEQLREHLRQKLPDYMIPTQFVWMDRLPVTANGKLNRKALPQPEPPSGGYSSGYVAPRSGLEEQIASIWKYVLGLDRISANANFFDLGGHSLLLVRVHSNLKQLLQTAEVSVIDLFAYPTIRTLARFIAAERNKHFLTAGRTT